MGVGHGEVLCLSLMCKGPEAGSLVRWKVSKEAMGSDIAVRRMWCPIGWQVFRDTCPQDPGPSEALALSERQEQAIKAFKWEVM